MNEKLIEKKLRESVKKLGGMALKFTSPGTAGVPDRIVIMPGGKIHFVEVKSAGKKLSPMQKRFAGKLTDLNFHFWALSSQQALDEFIYFLKIEQQ